MCIISLIAVINHVLVSLFPSDHLFISQLLYNALDYSMAGLKCFVVMFCDGVGYCLEGVDRVDAYGGSVRIL